MPDKEQVLKYYPDAKCIVKETPFHGTVYIIFGDERILTRSYQSEEKAWGWALLLANQFIMDKLKQ